jgi:hypothetical protein
LRLGFDAGLKSRSNPKGKCKSNSNSNSNSKGNSKGNSNSNSKNKDNKSVASPFGVRSCLRQSGRPLRGGLERGTEVPL